MGKKIVLLLFLLLPLGLTACSWSGFSLYISPSYYQIDLSPQEHPKNHYWVPGYWEERDDGKKHWVPGHWEPEKEEKYEEG